MTKQISLPNEQVVILGRTSPREHGLAFEWTNSGVYFRFRGKAVTFHFDVPALNQHLFLQIKIDGRWHRACVCEGATDMKVEALFDGEHIIHCVRITEVLDGVALMMNALTVDGTDAALLPAPALPERKMLFIGDSITCGFGILTEGLGSGFKTNEEDGAHTYAALTAAHFQAQAHFVCISGRGIERNCDNYEGPRIPELFEWASSAEKTPWDHTAYQPHVVVVNAGTNDTAGELPHVDVYVFKEAVTAFINRIHEVYPEAKIVWCYGMMAEDLHDALEEVINNLNDNTVCYCKMQTVWGFQNERGACSHPNLRAHRRCSGVLIDAVSEITGWEV